MESSKYPILSQARCSFMYTCMYAYVSYIYLCIYIYRYTPSTQPFKAFPVSKFNSETNFLYQLIKENSNFIVLKPCNMFIHVYMYVCVYICVTRWLSTDVFHSWSLRSAFDPETTSDVETEWGLQIWSCVSWCPERWRAQSANAGCSDRKPCTNWTALVVSVLF